MEQKVGRVVCVFCGSSNGNSPFHLEAARALARVFHEHGIQLVYGGGDVGVMGEVAKSLVALSGPDAVHGIIPRPFLENSEGEVNESSFGRTTIVPDMHSRKALMASEVARGAPGSGFVVLSGGLGTLEEAAENATWNQLGIHDLPVVLYNVDGIWDGLLQWVRTATEAGFISKTNAGILIEATTAEEVVRHLDDYRPSKERFKFNWEGFLAA